MKEYIEAAKIIGWISLIMILIVSIVYGITLLEDMYGVWFGFPLMTVSVLIVFYFLIVKDLKNRKT